MIEIPRIYFEIDCPKCGYTNLVRKTEYEDGDTLHCHGCFKDFTEYDN